MERSQPDEISAGDALYILCKEAANAACVDVRSEGEFAEGSIPGWVNLPILTNEERHQVGLCYKSNGQSAAVELGHQLVEPHRAARVQNWRHQLDGKQWRLVTCWRGGMRSKIASEWIGGTIRVRGGYKAMRRELLRVFENLPELIVVSGPTGSGKTRLLRAASENVLDLEDLAKHRGSAFGGLPETQPSQASFENAIALALQKKSGRTLLVEDESQMVGCVALPRNLKATMNAAPVIRVIASVDERVENILEEYVNEPLRSQPAELVIESLRSNILRIERKLGGLATQQILEKLKASRHREWIRDLLELYYDRAYAHSFERNKRQVIFEGDWKECQKWIQQNQFA